MHTGASVRYRTGVLNSDGSFTPLQPWKRNLVLDSGLDSVASRVWVDNIAFAAIGTGTNPTQRDSGATTFTATGGTLTANAAFFVSQDVGRLMRLDDGTQGYITAFTSSTIVTWSNAGTFASPAEGTVYYVNDTTLGAEVKRSNTYSLLSAGNGSAWTGTPFFTWTFTRTFIFSAEVGTVNYREVGWSWGTTATPLFGRDVLAGAGDTLLAGQQYVISVELTLAVTPNTAGAQSNVGTAWDTTGDAVWESATCNQSNQTTFAYIDSTGGKLGPSGLGWAEPCSDAAFKRINALLATFTLGTNTSVSPPAYPTNFKINTTKSSYVNGAFSRTFAATIGVADANGSHYGVTLSDGDWGRGFTVKFTTPQTKAGTQTLSYTFAATWNRSFA